MSLSRFGFVDFFGLGAGVWRGERGEVSSSGFKVGDKIWGDHRGLGGNASRNPNFPVGDATGFLN